MKVLHVIDTLNIGGAERVSVDLCNILWENGEDVSMLTLTDKTPLRKYLNPDIALYRLKRNWKWNIFKLLSLHIHCKKFDIIHIHLRYNFRYVALAKLVFRGKYRLLLHDHFGDIENDRHIPFALRFFLRNSWFAGVSQPLVEWATRTVGMPREKCFLLPNIIVKNCRSNKLSQSNDGAIRILHISNFRPSKNHAFAFELIRELQRSFSVRVCFIGQVIDPDYFRDIVDQTNQAGINKVITINHDCDNPQEMMKDYDLAIHTAHQESGPLVLMEYAAQNLPFIAFKTGEVAYQISKMIPDFFMSDFNLDSWVERINAILRNRSRYLSELSTCFDALYSKEAYYITCKNIYDKIHSEYE